MCIQLHHIGLYSNFYENNFQEHITLQRILMYERVMIIFILIFTKIILIECDCGLPSFPFGSKVRPLKSVYLQGDQVEYYCEAEETTLIGNNVRVCNSSKWSGPIPACLQEMKGGSIKSIEIVGRPNISLIGRENYNYPNIAFYGTNNEREKTCITLNSYSPNKRLILHLDDKKRAWKRFPYIKLAVDVENWSKEEKEKIGDLIKSAIVNEARRCQVLGSNIYISKYIGKNMERNLMAVTLQCDLMELIDDEDKEDGGYNFFYLLSKDSSSNITIEFESNRAISICEIHIYFESSYALYSYCGTPDVPLHSSYEYILRGKLYNGASYYKFWCNDGFRLFGSTEIVCGRNNRFMDEFPTCRPRRICPLPSNDDISIKIEFEKLFDYNGNNMTAIYGSVAIYSCTQPDTHNIKVVMIGDSVRYCGSQGKWTGNQPTCVEYKDLTEDRFAEITETHINDMTDYHEMLSELTFAEECGLPAMPIHLRPRSSLFAFDNSVDLRPSYPNGSKIYYRCEAGFDWKVPGSGMRQCINGTWNGRFGKCSINVKNKISIFSIQATNNSTGKLIKEIIIPNNRNASTFQWQEEHFVFYRTHKPQECPTFTVDSIQRWHIFLNETLDINRVDVDLIPGGLFKKDLNSGPKTKRADLNSTSITAEINGRKCNLINVLDYANWQTMLSFNCDLDENKVKSYVDHKVDLIIDPSKFPNHYKGRNISLCALTIHTSKNECGSPDEPLNSIVTINRVKNQVEYSCVDGYELVGPSVVRCSSNGKWIDSFPSCRLKELCSITSSNDSSLHNRYYNTRVIKNRKVAVRGSVVIHECADKKEEIILVGPKTRICNKYGQWSGSEPFCVDISFLMENGSKSIKTGQILAIILVTSTLSFIITSFAFLLYKKGYCHIKIIPSMNNVSNGPSDHATNSSSSNGTSVNSRQPQHVFKEYSVLDPNSLSFPDSDTNCLIVEDH